MTHQPPTAADLGRLKSEAWRAIRAFNASHDTADLDWVDDTARALDLACEQYRAVHYPNASSVFVLADDERGFPVEVYAVEGGRSRLVERVEGEVTA